MYNINPSNMNAMNFSNGTLAFGIGRLVPNQVSGASAIRDLRESFMEPENEEASLNMTKKPPSLSVSLKPMQLVAVGCILVFTLFIPMLFWSMIPPKEAIPIPFGNVTTRNFIVACSVSMCFPLLLDIAFDYLSLRRLDSALLNTRAASIFTLLLYCLTLHWAHQFHLLIVFEVTQTFVECGCILWMLAYLDSKNCWTMPRCALIIACYYIYCILRIVFDITFYKGLNVAATFFIFVALILGLILAIQWILAFRKELVIMKSRGPIVKMTNNDFYSIIGLFVITIAGIVYSTTVSLRYAGVLSEIAYDIILFVERCLLNFFICFLPGRIFHQCSVETEYDAEVKSYIVRYLSHELRTPMSIIGLGLGILENQVESNSSNSVVLNGIHELQSCCIESTELLDDLLLYDKLHLNKLLLYFAPISLLSFLAKTLQPILPAVKKSGVIFKLLESARSNFEILKTIKIALDSNKLGPQFLKLIHRALSGSRPKDELSLDAFFVPLNEGIFDIKQRRHSFYSIVPITSTTASGFLRFVLKSSKPISEVEKSYYNAETIRFKREATEGGGGTELGIFILKRIVELHGGKVGLVPDDIRAIFIDLPIVHSVSNVEEGNHVDSISERQLLRFKGSIAEISVNMSSSITPNVSGDSTVSANAAPLLRDRPVRIDSVLDFTFKQKLLVVDDSAVNRRMITYAMNSLGYECVEGEDGQEAVNLVTLSLQTEMPFDIILLDNEMPNMRGRDAIKIIRDMGFHGIVLGVTGNAMDEDIADFKAQGVDDVIVKPFNAEKFKAALRLLTIS